MTPSSCISARPTDEAARYGAPRIYQDLREQGIAWSAPHRAAQRVDLRHHLDPHEPGLAASRDSCSISFPPHRGLGNGARR